MIRSITLLGSSSGRNAGDAALISGIADSVDAELGRHITYEVPTIRPRFIEQTYSPNVVPVSLLPWNLSLKLLGFPTYRSIMRTDLTLVFDAVLFDRALYNPLFNFLSTLYLLLPHAKRCGRRLGCFNVSVGPITTADGRRMLKKVCESMDFITVRDVDSLNLLREIGLNTSRILVTADAALNVSLPEAQRLQPLLRRLGLDQGKETIAFNVSAYLDTWAGVSGPPITRDQFVKIYSAALEQVAAQTGAGLLFVSTQHHDLGLTRAVMQAVKTSLPKTLLSNTEYNHHDIKGALAHVALLFGMRLHATILASSALTPVAALPHQPKVIHYFRTIGLEKYILTFDNFSKESLTNHILKSWGERSAIKEQLKKAIPPQCEKAKLAAKLVLALHQERDLDQAIQDLARAGGSIS